MGALAYDKSYSVKPRRVVEVVTVGHAVEVSDGPQALGGRGGLVAGVVLDGLLVGTGVVGGTVEAEGRGVNCSCFNKNFGKNLWQLAE